MSNPKSLNTEILMFLSKFRLIILATSLEYPAAMTMTASTGSEFNLSGATMGIWVAGVYFPCLKAAESMTYSILPAKFNKERIASA